MDAVLEIAVWGDIRYDEATRAIRGRIKSR